VPRIAFGADAATSAGASEAILDARNVAGSIDETEDEVGCVWWLVAAGRSGWVGCSGLSWFQVPAGFCRRRSPSPQTKHTIATNPTQPWVLNASSSSSSSQQPTKLKLPKGWRPQSPGPGAAADAADAPRPNNKPQYSSEPVPWGAFLTSWPVAAVTIAHFCYNWGYYTLLAWLPSFFELALGLNVQESSFLTLIPYVAMVLMTPVVGPVADGLIKRGWSLTAVRKLAQGIAFVGPAACMVACAFLTPVTPAAASAPQTAALVALLSLGFALGAWSRAGLYCNHQDLSPKYASALLGITVSSCWILGSGSRVPPLFTIAVHHLDQPLNLNLNLNQSPPTAANPQQNTAGALPGVLGVTSAGYLLDATGSWALALFLPTAACQLFGAVFYSIFASSERQPWS
jgi:hypothetical protein